MDIKNMKTTLLRPFVCTLALLALFPFAAASAQTTDGLQNPFEVKSQNWRGKPHYEVLFMNRNAEGSGGAGNYFNSIGQSFDASNEVMDARFRALDPVKLKQEFGSDGVRFNGPRRFVANGFTGLAFDGGKQRVIGGIPTFLYGTFVVPDFDAFIAGKQPAYRETVSKRSTTFYYNAGEQVFELITPEGTLYTMFSASMMVDPDNTIDKLPTLGERLSLPKGWKFRVRTLEKDLALTARIDSEPANTVVLDEFENNYQLNTNNAEPKVLDDGAGAKPGRVENMHGVRYIEMFLAFRDPKTGKFVAGCYNPMFTSKGIPASKDTAPQAQVEGLDFERIKKEFNLVGASLNGPKLWTPDWSEVEVGVERDFNGIKAPWVAQLNMGDKPGNVAETTPYKPMTIARKSALGWKKGTTVLLLDDASGNTYVMKGFQLGLTPKYTYEQFVAAGQSQFKQLPRGWKFRVKKLEEELIETPAGGVATIMADEFFNVYDKTGPGMSNYKP
jgi:hypothetical protein